MNRFNRIGLSWVFVLSLVLLGEAPRPAWGADKKPVHLDILLPEDAELEIGGYKTKSTGETRRFESAPVEVGRTYAYSLKVAWHGHTLTRRIQVQPEHPLTLDLRKELKAAGSFALLAPPALMLQADQHLVFPLRVKRFDFPGSIRIHFENLPKGITVPEVKLSEDQNESHAMLFVAADAPQGTHEIRAAAASGAMKDVSTIKVTISKPEKKETKIESKPEKKPAPPLETKVERKPEAKPEKTVERKPETKPAPTPETKLDSKPSPSLRVLAPIQIELHPGQTKYVEIKVSMEGQESLSAEPNVTLAASPGSNLACEKWTSSHFEPSAAAHTVGFAIKAPSDLEPGERHVKMLVAAGAMKTERTLTVLVKPRERDPESKAGPAPSLQLVLPAGIELRRGRTTYIEMQVKTTDGSPLPEAPSVTLEGARLGSVPWSSSFKAGQPACTVGLALTAEMNTPAGDREVRVRAAAGRSTVEGTLRVTIKPGLASR